MQNLSRFFLEEKNEKMQKKGRTDLFESLKPGYIVPGVGLSCEMPLDVFLWVWFAVNSVEGNFCFQQRVQTGLTWSGCAWAAFAVLKARIAFFLCLLNVWQERSVKPCQNRCYISCVLGVYTVLSFYVNVGTGQQTLTRHSDLKRLEELTKRCDIPGGCLSYC
jgi:hypothetical protein